MRKAHVDPQPDEITTAATAWAEWQGSGLLGAIAGAVIGTDLDGRIFYCNETAQQLYGYNRDQLVGANVMDVFVESDNVTDASSVMADVLSGRSWSGNYAVKTGDGTTVHVRLTDSPLWRDGRVVGVIGVGHAMSREETAAAAARAADERLTKLARVTAELAATTDTNAVTSVVIAHAADAIGAAVASLSLLTSPDTLTLVGLRGGSSRSLAWSTYPLDANVPTSEALRTGRTIVLTGRAAIESRYPILAADKLPDDRSMVCLPLRVGERMVGAISLGFDDVRVPTTTEMEFLTVFADTCAQALERMRALNEAETVAARLTFLAEVSVQLADSLDYRSTLAKVAKLVVPAFADWCVVEMHEDGALRTLAVEHTDASKVALALELQRRYPPDPNAPTGAANVVRTGKSELYAEITDEMVVAAAVDAEQLRLTRELGLCSALFVPLVARGRVLGTITFVSAESGRRYGDTDLAFAEHLARRAASAIDNSQLFTQTQEIAVQLQRAALPDQLPELPGVEFACHYSPAGRTDVGGDFYDVIKLADGRIVAIVGDVMGRGVAAAAAMAQMRASIRAYIATDPDPVTVLRKLDAMFELYDMSQLVTLLYLVFDLPAHTLAIASAGHLPPILVDRDGVGTPIWGPISPPLGIGDVRQAQTIELPVGSTVVAYTDGLVERRGEDIDEGITRVIAAAGVLRDGDLHDRLFELATTEGDTSDDDVTVLAIRLR